MKGQAMGARNTKVKKTQVSCSLTPENAERLLAEADQRDLAPSILLEKGLKLLFEKWDGNHVAGATVPKP